MNQKFPYFSSKFIATRRTFTSLDELDEDVNLRDRICIEPTTSGTRYIFPLNGRFTSKELETAADDDEDSDSSSEDVELDEETEVQTTMSRLNAYPKIVFFGTGSSFPGVTKTVTAILVHTA